jgi:hypothetical protein
LTGALHLSWSHGTADVLPTAAMLRSVRFTLPAGAFAPFAEPTWLSDDAGAASLSGHMRCLGADFVCLPFGGGGTFSRSAPGWEDMVFRPADPLFHGRSADADWTVASIEPDAVTLTLDESEPSPIARLERRIAAVPGEPALRFRLTIHGVCPRKTAGSSTSRDCRLPNPPSSSSSYTAPPVHCAPFSMTRRPVS